MAKNYDLSNMSLDEIEIAVNDFDPFNPAESPIFESSKEEPPPDVISTEEMFKGTIEGTPDVISTEEMFAGPKLRTLDKIWLALDEPVAVAEKTKRLTGKGIWKVLGILSWPFERIEAGIATPATEYLKAVGPLKRARQDEEIKTILSTPVAKYLYKRHLRSTVTPYTKKVLGENFEPLIEDMAEKISTGWITPERMETALTEWQESKPDIKAAFLHGAKSFVPFTRNDPEKVKNFNDFWAAYYEAVTDEPAPEWLQQTSGVATSYLVTPFVFGKLLGGARAGVAKFPFVQKVLNNKLPTWEEAKLIRKANIFERNERATKLGRALADKDAKRIAVQLSRQSGRNITKEAVKLRMGQIIKGSITEQSVLAEAANPAIEELQANFKALQKLGILGEETYLTKLSKGRIAELTKEKTKLIASLDKLKTKVPYKEQLQKLAESLKVSKQKTIVNKLLNIGERVEAGHEKFTDRLVNILGLKTTTPTKLADWAARFEKADIKERNKIIDEILDVAKKVEGQEITGLKPLLKKISSMQYRYKGKADDIRALETKIADIDNKLWHSTHLGGEQYMPRMYATKEAEIAARRFPVKGGPKVKAQYAKARKEIPAEVRQQMGEILEPAYPVTKRLIQEGMDIETKKLFDVVAKQGEWVDDIWREGLATKALPDTASYGALRGKFVDQRVYNDIQELTRIRSDFESMYDSIIGSWKLGKVVLNPATHFRNTINNSMLLDLSGTDHVAQSRLFVKALQEIKAGSDEWKNAQKFFGRTTLVTGELLDDMLATVNKDKATGLRKTINIWNTVFSKVTGPAAKVYQEEEIIFKFMKYLEQREKGKSVIGAVQEANKWLFDYSDLSRFEKVVARRVMPFYTFPRKALPRVLEAAVDRPYALAKYPLLAWAEEKYALHKLELTDEDYTEIQKVLPEYMQKGSYLLMPYRDENGDLRFFDWTYIVPWGELFDAQDRGLLGVTVTNPLFQIVADITRNKSGFSGREIWDETDTEEEKTFKKMLHVWQAAMPSLMYKGIYWDKIYESATDKPSKMGKVQPIGPAIAHTIFGMRTQPIDVEQQRMFRLFEMQDKLRELEGKIRDIVIREANGNITEEEYSRKREQYIKQIQDLLAGSEAE